MAHRDVYELITRTLELKRKHKKHEEVLQEIYTLIDEYNGFVKSIDKKFDNVVTKMEALLDDGHTDI